MSKADLVSHLRSHDCLLIRQGKHEIWFNPSKQMTSPVPRHQLIDRVLVKKIFRELGIPNPPGF
jgi:HicA toxin of bacterial toxin-antitoxin,